jgi:hypothetical protein
MKTKFLITIFYILSANTHNLLAQNKSPILWINKVYFINIDTLTNKKPNYFDIASGRQKTKYINYTFKNTGNHVTFLDTILWGNRDFKQFITKPKEITTVSLQLLEYPYSNSHILDLNNIFQKKCDSIINILLPFYYKGKIYRENISCQVTFGKGKLIEYDSLHFDATQKITDIVLNNKLPCFDCNKFTHYFKIENISENKITCTKALIFKSDSFGGLNSFNPPQYVEILPGETYRIPAHIDMREKYNFSSQGIIEVFTDGISEIYKCEVTSKFERKSK